MILEASKKKSCSIINLFVENLRECKKQYLKNKTKYFMI